MTDNLELRMDAYLPLRDVVFQTLRAAILKGELKPGERLMELQLAAKLGVSRTPIREAIRMLEQEGLAVTIPRKGAEVAKMTEKDMEDVLLIRCSLEDLAVRLSCDKISAAELQELRIAMEDFEKKTKSDNVVEIAKADVTFHDILYKAADNPKLLLLLNNLREQMYRYRVEYLKDKNIYGRLIEEHRQMYDAIMSKDKERVADYVEKHLHNQAEAVKKLIREQG
ncbi:MAG: GntR family transcriptional regulator [Eubacterium sp.]